MAGELITITGIEQVNAMLSFAPKNIVAKAFVKALDAAGEVIEAELWPRVPQDLKAAMNKAHGGKGPLVGKLDRYVTLDSQFRGGICEIGFGDLGHIALWDEYGHRMVGHKPGSKPLGQTKPNPFMRPAFDASGDRAIEAFANVLLAELRAEYGG